MELNIKETLKKRRTMKTVSYVMNKLLVLKPCLDEQPTSTPTTALDLANNSVPHQSTRRSC